MTFAGVGKQKEPSKMKCPKIRSRAELVVESMGFLRRHGGDKGAIGPENLRTTILGSE